MSDSFSSDSGDLRLFAAGELPGERGVPLRRRLDEEADAAANGVDGDDRLREVLSAIEADDAGAFALLDALDACDPLPPAASRRAAASAGRAVRQWQAEGWAGRPGKPASRTRFPWWTYPASAAAAAALAFLVWWGNADAGRWQLDAPPQQATAPEGYDGWPPQGGYAWRPWYDDRDPNADPKVDSNAIAPADGSVGDGLPDVLPEAMQGYVLLPPPTLADLADTAAGVAGVSAGTSDGASGGGVIDALDWPSGGQAEQDLTVLRQLRDLTRGTDLGA